MDESAAALARPAGDFDAEQSFAVEALGPHTRVVSGPKCAISVLREGKLVGQVAPGCEDILAIEFRDLDGDGRIDLIALATTVGQRVIEDEHGDVVVTKLANGAPRVQRETRLVRIGVAMLQQEDGRFVDASARLDPKQIARAARSKELSVRDVAKAFRANAKR